MFIGSARPNRFNTGHVTHQDSESHRKASNGHPSARASPERPARARGVLHRTTHARPLESKSKIEGKRAKAEEEKLGINLRRNRELSLAAWTPFGSAAHAVVGRVDPGAAA